MGYKVCIPTAGTGSRLGVLTRFLNKSLVEIANRPTICHLIEQFPEDCRFVIALGYKGNLVREFIGLAYPDRHFEYAEVQPYEGEGSGLGLSLLACEEFLQEPFVFISCDTLVDKKIPLPIQNWMGVASAKHLNKYRTISIANGRVNEIFEKGSSKDVGNKAYIGLAGIYDYEEFWIAMRNGGLEAIQVGESYGLRTLISKDIYASCFTWHDTGNIDALNETREVYRNPDQPNILEKANEAIWFIGNKVIKFSDDKKFISNRVKRADELNGFVPEVTGSGINMYRYDNVEGIVFSDVVSIPLFNQLLEHSAKFWVINKLNQEERENFKETCKRFYKDKTFERVELFYTNFLKKDGVEKINGIKMPLLKDLLHAVDWEYLSDGMAGRFHGDFHFENILWSKATKKFTFLDWRQDFGGNRSIGDIYYDLAKLLHGLIINHEIIAKNHFNVKWSSDDIRYDFHRKEMLVLCEHSFYSWLKLNDYDVKKVRLLTAMIYLNIAALHHAPYCNLLYAHGKSMLKAELG